MPALAAVAAVLVVVAVVVAVVAAVIKSFWMRATNIFAALHVITAPSAPDMPPASEGTIVFVGPQIISGGKKGKLMIGVKLDKPVVDSNPTNRTSVFGNAGQHLRYAEGIRRVNGGRLTHGGTVNGTVPGAKGHAYFEAQKNTGILVQPNRVFRNLTNNSVYVPCPQCRALCCKVLERWGRSELNQFKCSCGHIFDSSVAVWPTEARLRKEMEVASAPGPAAPVSRVHVTAKYMLDLHCAIERGDAAGVEALVSAHPHLLAPGVGGAVLAPADVAWLNDQQECEMYEALPV